MLRGRKNSSMDSKENKGYLCQWLMLQTISPCRIRLSPWITTSRKKRTARGSSIMARLTMGIPIRETTSLKVMEMVVTPMAIGTMVETRETTPMEVMVTKMEEMDITMETTVTRMEEIEITMETMVSITITQKLRRISLISHASIARRKDIIPQTAQNLPSPIHSRRDM
jgi:hypothetical protein